MSAIERESPNQFRVRFREVGTTGLRRFLGGSDTQVDPLLLAKSIMLVMRKASMRSASGQILVWNDYRVILHPDEFEPLRALRERFQRELGEVLTGEVQRLKGELVGDLCVHLIADEGNDVPTGVGVMRVAFASSQPTVTDAAGEMTVRFDSAVIAGEIKAMQMPAAHGHIEYAANSTISVADNIAGYTLQWPGGRVHVPDGIRTAVGRAHAGSPPNFIALTGASGKINKQQLWLLLDRDAVTVGRFPRANPVAVDGTAIAPGQSLRCTGVRVHVDLSHATLLLTLSRE